MLLLLSVSAFTADGRMCVWFYKDTYFRNKSYRDQRNKGQLKFYVFNISFIYMMFFGPYQKIYMCTVRIGLSIYSLSQWTSRSRSSWIPFLFMTYSFELYSTPKYLLLYSLCVCISVGFCFKYLCWHQLKTRKSLLKYPHI